MNAGLPFEPGPLRGELHVPGDKSISHRALITGASLRQPVRITGANSGRDVRATLEALRVLGACIEQRGNDLIVCGSPLRGPAAVQCHNSGSTARMLLGACAGADVAVQFDGDDSLRRRPMEPVAAQLRAFGAHIETAGGRLPMTLAGTPQVETRDFILLTGSSQVKSALLFAGLYAGAAVTISGDRGTRDHTERLLRYLDADIDWNGRTVALRPRALQPKAINIVGDFSGAAFAIAAAAIVPGSALIVRNVGVNSTRTGLLDALQAMGARITLRNIRTVCEEPVADIAIEYASLRGVVVGADMAMRAIDEIPLIAVVAAFAQGQTRIDGIRELRTKESDRFAAIERILSALRIQTTARPDGLTIFGGTPSPPSRPIETHGDHRIAMTLAVIGCSLQGIQLDDPSSVDVSFPEFFSLLKSALPQRP